MRKRHVRSDQDEILAAITEVCAEGGVGFLPDVAEHFGISEATARRQLDGLVAQGKLVLAAGHGNPTREYLPTSDPRAC